MDKHALSSKLICKFLLVSCLFLAYACDKEEQLDVDDIHVPEGYALSAGTATGFYNSSVAYDQGTRWLSGAYDIRFRRGDRQPR